MKSFKLLPLIFIVGVLAVPPPTDAATTVESRPTTRNIDLDGSPTDWEGIPVMYLEESLRALAVTHDRDNLYLMYRFADDRLARELLSRGAVLWVNSEAKTRNKDEAYGLRYGGSSAIQSSLDETAVEWQGVPDDDTQDGRRPPPRPPKPESARTHPDELTRIRLGVKETVEQGPAAEPAAASSAADGGFCYELRIPIADIGGRVAAQDPSKVRTVAIGIQIGGLTEAERDALDTAPANAPGGGGAPRGESGGGRGGMDGVGGMGGPGGGGGPMGGPPGGGRGDMKKRLDPEITWLKVVLQPAS